MAKYEHILKDNKKVQVDSAIRDGDGVKISTNYAKKDSVVNLITDQEIDGQKDFLEIPRVLIKGEGGETHNLPSEYAELQYIYVNGGESGQTKSYFDSRVQIDDTIEFELKYSYENVGPGTASGQGVVLGARVSSSSWVCTLSGYSSFATGYFGFNNNLRSQAYLAKGDNQVSFRNVEGDPTKGVYTCINSRGTNTYTINRQSGYPSTAPTLTVGCLHDGSNFSENLNGRIYYIKIWKQGQLVREYYPCRQGVNVGLYDKVNNEFNTSQTGTQFVSGPMIGDQKLELMTNANVPSRVGELTNDVGYITSAYHDSTKQNTLNTTQMGAVNSGITNTKVQSYDKVVSYVPEEASTTNQLADKEFVNSSIATNTATFRGTYDDISKAPSTAEPNDYIFITAIDELGNTSYNRYKYCNKPGHEGHATWEFEYTLNNSSFTAEQWATINSGVTEETIRELEEASANHVTLDGAQVINGQKDFTEVPRIYVPPRAEGHNLPEEYDEILYLGGTGPQYIDLNYTPTSANVVFDMEIMCTRQTGNRNFICCVGSPTVGHYCEILPSGYFGTRISNVDYSTNVYAEPGEKYNVIMTKTASAIAVEVNGSSVSSDKAQSATNLTPVNLFRLANGYVGESIAFYSCKLYDNGTLVREVYPAQEIASGTLGMYDKVSNTFFTNAGTGVFASGGPISSHYENFLTNAGLSLVATTGSYTDLLNKPSMPSVYNGKLTIQRNGVDVQTFTANQSSNVTANINVPTSTSQLTNDSGFQNAAQVNTLIEQYMQSHYDNGDTEEF